MALQPRLRRSDIRLRAVNGDDYPFAAGDRDRGYNYEPTFILRGLTELHITFDPIR